MAKVDLLNNVLASGDQAQWQKTAQSKKALVEAAHGDRDISTLRPVRSVQPPTEPDASWMQNIFTAPGQSRGGATPAVPSVTPVQTPALDAAVGNMPGTGTMSTDYLSVTGQDFGQATDKNPLEEQTPALVAWLRSRFAQGVSENRLGQDGAAAEMAGQSEEPAYTGDPEDVARQEWALYGAKNEAEYRKAAGDEAKYVGRQAAQGAMDTVRNTANDVGYRAQVGAGRAAAEDAYWADVMTGSVNPDDFSEYQKAEQDNTVTELKQASHLGESYAQKTAEMFPEVTDSMRQLGTIASGITGMAPQIAIGAASLALGNAAPALASVLKVAGSATLFSSASGAATTDALYAGANAEDAVRYGTAVGMVEIATEKIANGLGLFGKAAGLGGVTDDLTAGLVRKYVNDKGAQKAILYLAGMLGEGFEEYIAEFADHFANKVMVGTDQRTWEQTGKDAVNSFIVGALISAVMQTSNVFQSGGNVTPEQMADIAADSMKQAEQTATQEAAPAETGTPATQPATATAPEITAPPTTTSTFATVPYAAAEIASRSAPQTSGANIGPTPHSYQEAQQQIDDYEDGLIAKYGEEEVLFLDPESKLNFSTFQPSKLSDAEINQLSVLYQGRDGIADSEKNTFIDSVMASVPSKDYTNDGWAATRDGIREALEEIYKDNARLLALHGQEQTVNLAETLYNILIRKTDAPHELWGQYDLAQYVSENPFSTPLGQTPAPLLEQINDIVNAIVRPTAPPSAVNLLPSPRAPATAQEAPGEALAPGGVVTAPTPINAPTQVLNQPGAVSGVAPTVAAQPVAEVPQPQAPQSDSTTVGQYEYIQNNYQESRDAYDRAIATNDPNYPYATEAKKLSQMSKFLREEQGNYYDAQKRQRESGGQLSKQYGTPDNHIDNRSMADVGSRSVMSFQWDYPELHSYYADMAKTLLGTFNEAQTTTSYNSKTGKYYTAPSGSAVVTAMQEYGMSKADVSRALLAMINNHGAENYANAKRIELYIDNLLTQGGRITRGGEVIPPNEAYIASKAQLPGGDRAAYERERHAYEFGLIGESQETVDAEMKKWDEEHPFRQQPVAAQNTHPIQTAVNAVGATSNQPASFSAMQNQTAADATAAVVQNAPAAKPAVTVPNSAPANPSVQSTAPGTFDEMLQQSPGVHPVNAEGAANAQLYQNRDVTQVPTQNFQGHLTSKTASTIMNAGITPTALVTQMQEEMAKGTFSRIAYTDEAAQASSEAHIADVGWDVALAEYQADTRAGKSSKDITALGTTLFNNALTNGDMLTAMDIATRMIENRKTTAQSLQATNMLNKTTPDGRLYMAMRSIDNIREQLIQKYGDKAPELKIDDTLMQEYYDALKSGDKETETSAWRNVEQNIADQVPSTWKDKLNAWRYLSMLGNPRTHIRNIVGNAGFVPVRAMKNIIATSIESAFSLDGRTKAFLNYASSADRALINLAASDFKNMEEYIQSGGKYVDTNSAIEDMRTIFNVKPLEWLRKLNTAGLNKEDVLFSKPIYAAALASYWKANGITAQDITAGNVSAEAMSTAQLYAAKEAAKATYRDSNWFSDWVSKLGKNYQGSSPIAKAANVLVEGVIPFKRTPANILARAFEYSPAGLVKGIYDMTVNIKSGKVTAAESIDTFSAGLTGTGLLALGALLAAHGLVSGSADDDEKQSNFDKLRGSQNYSITIGNKNYTLDWLAPEALPFFVGVEVFNHFIDSGANKSWQDFTKSLTGITEPLLETSMLSSLEDLFSSIKYADGDYIGIAAKTAATSYLSQFMPTIFGQAERAFLETQREETYRYGESDVLGSSGQYSLGSLFNKVPGVDYNQIPYVNAWGERTDTGNLFERIVNNFLNPAYVAKTGGSQTDAELQRLYDLGFNTVLPSRAEQSKQIRLYDSDGNVMETTHMTADEYVAFNEKAGKLAQSYIGSMVSSDFYKGLNDDEKADMIERVYDYANQIATSEMAQGRGANYPVDTWVSNAMSSDNPLHYIEMYTMYGSSINSDRYAALVQGGMTETEAGSLYQAVSDDLDGDSTNAGILSAVTSQNLSSDKMDVALKAYLPESAYSKYYTARIAGIAPQSYADYYRIQSGYGTSQADVYAAMNHTDWTPEQKATVWAAYGWKTNYDTYAASH